MFKKCVTIIPYSSTPKHAKTNLNWMGFPKQMTINTRASQKVRFLPNNFFEVSHNFFPLFRSKALQKTKNWKFLWIFSPGWSPLKFYYITLPCEMELGRKFKFFPIFHYKTILFSSESEFSMKNVIFWGTSCWCSSKIKKIRRGTHKLQLQLMSPPSTFLIFWAA